MILTLSDEFDALVGAAWNEHIHAIENLLTAHVEGWHLLALKRGVASELSKHPALSMKHKAVLKFHIYEKAAVLQGQANSVSNKLVCCISTDAAPERDGDLLIPLSEFSSLENCFKSVLLVENISSDGNFYMGMAEILRTRRSAGPRISLDVVNGGGTTTSEVLKRYLQCARPCLTIVDSDKGFREDKGGETARRVSDVFNSRVFSSHLLCMTDVRSIENYVPLDVAECMLGDSPAIIEKVRALSRVLEFEKQSSADMMTSVLAYINMKKGLKISSYRKGCRRFKDSVSKLCQELGVAWNPPADNDNSRDDEYFVPPIHSKYVETFNALLVSRDERIHLEGLSAAPYWPSLSVIVEKVVAFGTAAGKLPISLSAAAVASVG